MGICFFPQIVEAAQPAIPHLHHSFPQTLVSGKLVMESLPEQETNLLRNAFRELNTDLWLLLINLLLHLDAQSFNTVETIIIPTPNQIVLFLNCKTPRVY